jgi:hypothetical protein
VTFDDRPGQNQVLNGQYPTGVIDWGTNQWYHSGPFGLFTTKSVGFNGAGPTSASFTFLIPRRLASLQAYNGGGGSTTVTVSCPGQPTKTQNVAAGQVATLNTGWTGTCSSVTLTSTNGWDTNFDNLVLDAGSGGTTASPTTMATATQTATVAATRTASATMSPTRTPAAATATRTPTASPAAQTVTFDDRAGQNQVLNGQYPAGVIDWGTNQWYLSAPWGLFTTKSMSFNGAGLTSASFSFVTPRRLVSLQAYNGGSVASTITLNCAGQPTRTQSVPAGQVAAINTGWSGTCASVTLASTNGWDTNFDNLVYDAG